MACCQLILLCIEVDVNNVHRRVNRDVAVTTDERSSAAGPDEDTSSLADTRPKLDLAFKDGETIKINITVSAVRFLFIHYGRPME